MHEGGTSASRRNRTYVDGVCVSAYSHFGCVSEILLLQLAHMHILPCSAATQLSNIPGTAWMCLKQSWQFQL